GIKIIIFVDLILGPTLTLIVFKPGKPGLKTDLTLIGVFQTVCLLAGTYVVWSERPIAMVFQDGQFFSMSRDDFTAFGVEVPDLSRFNQPSPVWVSVAISKDPTEQSELRKRALETKQPLRTMTELYVPFSTDHLNFDKDPYPNDRILDRDRDTQDVPRWLAEHGGTLEDYAFYRFGTRYRFIFIGADRATHRIKGILKTPGPL
ncbi:MAG: hypothetical protein O3A63_14930, partial [Proteobacteria bacterium]|nr:hypothetical protein [Pseudomonadota bacterium]